MAAQPQSKSFFGLFHHKRDSTDEVPGRKLAKSTPRASQKVATAAPPSKSSQQSQFITGLANAGIVNSIKPYNQAVSSLTSVPEPAHHAQFIAALSKAGISGSIKTRGHIDYDIDARPWNLRCAPRPLAIVYVRNAQDVALAVKAAAAYGVPVQPRSGGHSFGSFSLGGKSGALVVDLKALDAIHVDRKSLNATIGSGTRLASVTKGLYDQGKRAIAHGTCPQVGIGGHATIGGQGPLSRLWGLTLDHIVEVEVVLADGSITHANKSKNSDLFWALRGAGASFGIITSFVFMTHPAPTTVTHYSFQFTIGSPTDLANAFAKWQAFISTPAVLNDRNFNSVITISKSSVLVQGTRYGKRAELQKSEVNVHLMGMAKDIKIWELDFLASVVHWAEDEFENIGGAISIPLYVKNLVVKQSKPLTPEAIHDVFTYMHTHATHDSMWYVLADLEGGRISDFRNDETAYAQRDALYTFAAYAIAPLPFPDDVLALLTGMIDCISTAQPDGNFGAYPGYVDPLLPKTEWPTQYWGVNYTRLLAIKKKYDPKNVFSNSQSVGTDRTAL